MRRITPVTLVLLSTLFLSAAIPAPAAERHGIARIWKGRTLAEKADAYEKYLGETGIPMILATPGNLGVQMLRRDDGREVEFVVISLWQSIEAVQKFAGPDYKKAVILERDREFLVTVEPNVLHYDIVKLESRK